MDSPTDRELQELRELIAQLTSRVHRLEQVLGATAPPEQPQRHVELPEAAPPPRPAAYVPPPHPPAPASSFGLETFERYVTPPLEEQSLESKIGSQWFNRIGIVAVLIGVAYFLKYAFDSNWIGAGGRVAIGLIAGIAIVLWSERFRSRGYNVFSYSLKAVGIGTLYLSLWASFQLYQLVSAGAAFGAMVIVTAATAVLALKEDAEILAAMALLGGFITPALVSTHQNREAELFAYLTLLDLATLVLVAFRPWRRLMLIAFFGTVLLYIGWYAQFYTRGQLGPTLAFVTIFFAIFALAPLISLWTKAASSVSRTMLVLPLINAGVYFVQLYVLLEDISKTALAWSAIGLAAVYLLLSREIQRRSTPDEAARRLMQLLHVGLAVGFLTVAIPLKLESYWITIGWLVESAVLLYVGYRGQSNFLKILATAALALGIVRLIVWDSFTASRLLFNDRFAVYLVAIAAVAWAVTLARRANTGAEYHLAAFGAVLVNVLALVALSLEVRDYFQRAITEVGRNAVANRGAILQQTNDAKALGIARDFSYSAVWMAYGAALMAIGFWKRTAFLRWQALVLIAVTIVKVFTYDVSELEQGYRILSFIALGVLLLIVSFAYQKDWLKLSSKRAGGTARGTTSTPA
jgi:uncharacterized membrane protein